MAKEGYELLKGVELPEYYHVIRYEQDGRSKDYRINDSTGELED